MKPLFAALAFLSIAPVPARWCGGKESLARSLPWFPVVGLLIGAGAALLSYALAFLLPPLPVAALLVIALMTCSGGLHVDGLADTADGFFSSRSRERILEIMRDSRTGAMGAAAVASILVLKTGAVAAVSPDGLARAVFLMPLAGRCALVWVMAGLPYARIGGGLPSVFAAARPWHALWAASLLAAAGWIAAGWRGVAAAGFSIFVAGIFSFWSWRKIGGFTGDTLGATCEIVEVVPALVLASQLWQGGAQ
jgi:adenosylcobinamide-GDP ribazoletransferase